MREKLYADILYALGAPANRANMVRLFINGQGFGTFNMLDDVIHYSFIRAVFYNGNPPNPMGPLYDGATGADFQYYDDNDKYYAWIPAEGNSPDSVLELKALAKAFRDTDVTNDQALDKFGQIFDIDHFLRFMVVEFLTGDWDGYWMEQTNDGAYRDPTENNKWYYLGQDFDATFGVNLDQPGGRDFVNTPYTKYSELYPDAVMINRLLQNAKTKNDFETYLKNTVLQIFNNVTLTNRILAYREFIEPDLKWDRNIKQQSPGINFGWTFEQTWENLWQAVSAPNNNGGGAGWGLIEW